MPSSDTSILYNLIIILWLAASGLPNPNDAYGHYRSFWTLELAGESYLRFFPTIIKLISDYLNHELIYIQSSFIFNIQFIWLFVAYD